MASTVELSYSSAAGSVPIYFAAGRKENFLFESLILGRFMSLIRVIRKIFHSILQRLCKKESAS